MTPVEKFIKPYTVFYRHKEDKVIHYLMGPTIKEEMMFYNRDDCYAIAEALAEQYENHWKALR